MNETLSNEAALTHTVSIPEGNGYRESLDRLDRVVEHIKQMEIYGYRILR